MTYLWLARSEIMPCRPRRGRLTIAQRFSVGNMSPYGISSRRDGWRLDICEAAGSRDRRAPARQRCRRGCRLSQAARRSLGPPSPLQPPCVTVLTNFLPLPPNSPKTGHSGGEELKADETLTQGGARGDGGPELLPLALPWATNLSPGLSEESAASCRWTSQKVSNPQLALSAQKQFHPLINRHCCLDSPIITGLSSTFAQFLLSTELPACFGEKCYFCLRQKSTAKLFGEDWRG